MSSAPHPRGFRRLLRLWRRDPARDVAEELRFHLDASASEHLAQGMTAEEARIAALRRFGNIDRVTHTLVHLSSRHERAARWHEWLDGVRQDVRVGVRQLVRSPGFTLTVVLTLGLGIGANAAMFGIVDRLLLSPPQEVRDADRVFQVAIEYTGVSGTPFTMSTTSYPTYTDIRAEVPALSAVAALAPAEMTFGSGESARPVAGIKASGGYFGLLGPSPALGRFFGVQDDDEPAGNNVAVISHAFWRREFGADAGVLGRQIVLDNATYTIVGVAPAEFTGDRSEPVDVWVPLSAGFAGQAGDWRHTRGLNIISVLVRVRDGIPPLQAAAQATLAVQRGITAQGDDETTTRTVLQSLVPGRGASRGSTESSIALWLMGMSMVVFLITLANVTTLVLLRVLRRRREVAVRLALGVGRWRLVRQLTVESLLFAVIGGLLALVVAIWGGELVRSLLLPRLAPSERLIPTRVLAITAIGTVAATLVSGLSPALRASRASFVGDLKAGGGSTGFHPSRLLSGLLVAQNGLSVLLLVGAGLFVTSLHRVRTQDFGFTTDHVLLATMKFAQEFPGAARDTRYREAEQQVRRLPGVEQTSLAQAVPFAGHNIPPIGIPGRADFPDPKQQAPFLNAATPSYFGVLGMHMLAGRNFDERDRAGSPLVVIVNDAMARGLWPNESALGKCIQLGFAPDEPPSLHASASLPCREVVGVVNNARPRSIREESGQARMMYYTPFEQVPPPPAMAPAGGPTISSILIRTNGAAGLATTIQRTMQSFATDLPLSAVLPLQNLLDVQIRPWTLGATMFSAFGMLALLLAAIGLYGVRAYSVAQRTREMGVRLALGAPHRSIIHLILAEGLRLTVAGLVIGGVVALLAGRFIEPLLFQTSSRDPAIFGSIAIVLIAVGIAANAVPAWRASRVAPARALRME